MKNQILLLDYYKTGCTHLWHIGAGYFQSCIATCGISFADTHLPILIPISVVLVIVGIIVTVVAILVQNRNTARNGKIC